MDDAENTEQAAPDSNSNPPPQAPSVPPNNQSVLREGEGQPPDEEVKETRQLIQSARTIEWLQLSVNALLAVVGIVAIFIYFGQLEVMKGQLGEIVRQYPEIQKQAKAATDSVVQAKQDSDKNAKTIVEQLRIARKQAQAALDQADSAKVADRAWMTWSGYQTNPFSAATDAETGERNVQGVMFRFEWINSGHTPAIKCDLFTEEKVVTDMEGPIPIFKPSHRREQHQSPVVPGIKIFSQYIMFRRNVIDDLKNHKCRVFLYSRAEYQIVYPKSSARHTELCVEVIYQGISSKTGEELFGFVAVGSQNSAT